MAADKFICPLLWQHISCHPDGDLRVCCHGLGHNKIEEDLTIFQADQDILNHDTYKTIRKEMLEGRVPEVCQSCKVIEDIGGESPRLRYLKGTGEEMSVMLEETKEDGSISRSPREIDLTLGNSCNFKCRMCSPMFSDRLKETFDIIGLKYNHETVEKIEKRWNKSEINIPLLESNELESLVFQGGEPLLYRNHLTLLRTLVETGRANRISLSYDTNFSVIPPESLELWKSFKQVELDISLDGVGNTFEYIRYGSNWKKIESNILEITSSNYSNIKLQFSTLIQVGLIHGLKELLVYCLSLPMEVNRIPKFSLIESPEFLGLNATSKNVFEQVSVELSELDLGKLKSEEKEHFDELLTLLDSYSFDPELHFKFLAHTKALDKVNDKAMSYFDLLKTTS